MGSTYKDYIKGNIIPHIEYYFNEVYKQRENLVIDGTRAFNDIDVFVAGKMVNAFTYLVSEYRDDHEKYREYKGKLKELIKFASNMEFKTWGSLSCLTGLYRLKRLDILSEIVDEDTLEELKVKCDWRKFINLEDMSLIKLVTNYYGVAFGISRYMELLGWDNSGYSKKLFDKLMEHIENYSGGLGYMDETIGEGRFDRYSLLTPGELGAMFMETETKIPERLLDLLRKSCDIHLNLANEEGDGFSYGRSIGAYGDTSSMEVLSSAACLNVLNKEEKILAYSFNIKIIEKFISFWLDDEMKSVNLWEKGRRTDNYRNKNRILGENLSLCMQLVGVGDHWEKAGFGDTPLAEDYSERLLKLPKYSFYQFLHRDYDRGMAIIRDGKHVISLPLINGGMAKYKCTPYLPVPNSNRFFESGADTNHPNLVPRLISSTGDILMPISYFKNMSHSLSENEFIISYNLNELADLKDKSPNNYKGIRCESEYRFTKGCIERTETYYTTGETEKLQSIVMEFGVFSQNPVVEGSKIYFSEGSIKEVDVDGMDIMDTKCVSGIPEYNTSHGPLQTLLMWQVKNVDLKTPKKIKWTIKYR